MKINIPIVENMTGHSGREITNQFIIKTKDKTIFQSYSSIIAVVDYKKDKTYLDKNEWDYSKTTGKYRNMFLNENITETRKKIKSGEYKLVDLNKR